MAIWRMRALARNLSLVAAGAVTLALLNNNFSLSHPSRQTFTLRLDHAIRLSTNWLAAETIETNAALLYMIADMANLSGEVGLRRIVEAHLNNPLWSKTSVFRRLVDDTAQARPPSRTELDTWEEYQRWIAYGSAPDLVRLTGAEQSNMFTDRYRTGRRTHQLLALLLYRRHAGNSPAVENLINRLCEGIASEGTWWDVRMTDFYVQRVAFVLAAGRPDLVKGRWVERIIARQEPNGGWLASWYGWGPSLFEFHFRNYRPNSHTTVQAMWILYMLRYRYPEWIERNHPD